MRATVQFRPVDRLSRPQNLNAALDQRLRIYSTSSPGEAWKVDARIAQQRQSNPAAKKAPGLPTDFSDGSFFTDDAVLAWWWQVCSRCTLSVSPDGQICMAEAFHDHGAGKLDATHGRTQAEAVANLFAAIGSPAVPPPWRQDSAEHPADSLSDAAAQTSTDSQPDVRKDTEASALAASPSASTPGTVPPQTAKNAKELRNATAKSFVVVPGSGEAFLLIRSDAGETMAVYLEIVARALQASRLKGVKWGRSGADDIAGVALLAYETERLIRTIERKHKKHHAVRCFPCFQPEAGLRYQGGEGRLHIASSHKSQRSLMGSLSQITAKGDVRDTQNSVPRRLLWTGRLDGTRKQVDQTAG